MLVFIYEYSALNYIVVINIDTYSKNSPLNKLTLNIPILIGTIILLFYIAKFGKRFYLLLTYSFKLIILIIISYYTTIDDKDIVKDLVYVYLFIYGIGSGAITTSYITNILPSIGVAVCCVL